MPAMDTSRPAKVRVLLAIFEFPMLVTAFRAVIDAAPDMRVVGEVVARDRLVDEVTAAEADIVIAECERPAATCSTFESIGEIKRRRPDLRVVALECQCGADQFSLALKAGADGFLTREADETDVVAAIRGVAAGHTYVSPTLLTRMVEIYVRRTSGGGDPYDTLSDREREILLLASIGHTNREMARTLHLSEQTIHNYRANVMEKLGLHDRVELLKYAVRRGLLTAADL
jgi:DNA-binding NarL/FixJ family response regulator